jgi:carboxylesterase
MARTRYADWLAAVEQATDDLAARCEHVALVGLSMGGTLCLDAGARRDVAAVVSINAPLLDRGGILPRLAGVVQHLVPMLPPAALDMAENDIKAGGDEQAYDRVPSKAGYSLARALPRVRAQLPQLTAPVLVCWSREDHTVPPENSHRLAELLPGEVRTLELSDSYHVATLDNDQALLFATVTDFLDEVTDVAGNDAART